MLRLQERCGWPLRKVTDCSTAHSSAPKEVTVQHGPRHTINYKCLFLQAIWFLILVKENFQLTVAVRLMPPLSFFLKPILGGLLFRRIPNPSSSFSMIFLWPRGFSTSRTIRMRLQVRATKNQKKKATSQKACSHNWDKTTTVWLDGLMTLQNP